MSTVSQQCMFTDPNEFMIDDLTIKLPKKFNQMSQCSAKKNLTDRIMLIEKKKNYSQAIRQRNMNLATSIQLYDNKSNKKNGNSQLKGKTPKRQPLNSERECCSHKNTTFRDKSMKNDKKQNEEIYIPKLTNRSRKQKALNQTCRINLRNTDNNKSQILDPHRTQISEWNFQVTEPEYKNKAQNIACFKIGRQLQQKQHKQNKQKIKIDSQVLCLNLSIQRQDEDILRRQNQTFKRDLAYFRKQVGNLQKQLDKSKCTIKQYQNVYHEIINNINKNKCPMTTQKHLKIHKSQKQSVESLKCKLQALNNQYTEHKLSALLRQKKLSQQISCIKKKMNKQVSLWQQKYQKVSQQKQKVLHLRDIKLIQQVQQSNH